MDLHAAQVLGELATELAAAGIRTQVLEASASVRDTLRAEGLEEKLGNIIQNLQVDADAQCSISRRDS